MGELYTAVFGSEIRVEPLYLHNLQRFLYLILNFLERDRGRAASDAALHRLAFRVFDAFARTQKALQQN